MRFFFLPLFAALASAVYSQSPRLQKLHDELKNHPLEDTVRAKLLNELSLRVLKYEPRKSLIFAERALQLSDSLKFQSGIAEARNNMAVYYLVKGDADLALEHALAALKIGEQTHRVDVLANSYAILGTIYHSQLDYDKARSYLLLAQKANLKPNNIVVESKILNSFGSIASDRKKYDTALYYFGKALKVMEDNNEDYRIPEVINNIGLVYTRQDNNKEAVKYYFKSLDAARKNFNNRAEALALFNIGNTILNGKNYAEAEKFLLQSLAISRKNGEAKMISSNYMALGQLKNETGKFGEAHRYISGFYELKDSLLNVEKVKKIAELEVKYETEKKEHAIQLLERDNRIQNLKANILFSVLFLLAVLSTSVYYLQQSRERKNRMILNLEIDRLTTQNIEISEKYKDVLASGNAKTIESVDQRLLKKTIEVVENKMGDPLFGVEQMAKELGMSRTNLHRKIKAITGFPPSELIRNIRLRKAAALLLNKADNVSQISFTVGFEDHSYFSKSFKKQYGVTPTEYIQSKEKMN
ncbi:hypothetical protein WSM22_29810 [Cytophagales bacterium WSM2-2]|nr:hypothetical protein WSM22_29810 [Cytophagales bacterium WSM2-2]